MNMDCIDYGVRLSSSAGPQSEREPAESIQRQSGDRAPSQTERSGIRPAAQRWASSPGCCPAAVRPCDPRACAAASIHPIDLQHQASNARNKAIGDPSVTARSLLPWSSLQAPPRGSLGVRLAAVVAAQYYTVRLAAA